jgi:hypothetical protein
MKATGTTGGDWLPEEAAKILDSIEQRPRDWARELFELAAACDERSETEQPFVAPALMAQHLAEHLTAPQATELDLDLFDYARLINVRVVERRRRAWTWLRGLLRDRNADGSPRSVGGGAD